MFEAQNLLGCTAMFSAMMEAACTSETSVEIQLRTRQSIREDSELHTRRRENLKSQINVCLHYLFIVYLMILSVADRTVPII
jgi:hypothetical protein